MLQLVLFETPKGVLRPWGANFRLQLDLAEAPKRVLRLSSANFRPRAVFI